ncbi:crotonase/enoyl-CoA hydratase family protein [Sphingobium estronivorans]|uniref:crotonase/enoyl-CoA hydratase family protein n=1 Tax=Sphingobium estronivorans TaxID=1577690 RepID=UPI001239D24E|nr:crotonase/enoyl-CoA hydratase family protein [Sphingobium estronivorans]
MSFIKTEIADGVMIVTMDSPETRNALGSDVQYGAIEDVCRRISADRSIRAVVWTGAGRAFCAGGDIKLMRDRVLDPGLEPIEDRYHYKEGIHRIPLALYNLEVPVIAAVNGPAIGAGLDLACMCDIRIASEAAKFAESFVTLGIIPGDGGAFLLQRLVGPSKAAELTFTGDVIDAPTALQCGLVSQVVAAEELLPRAVDMAQRIARNPPHVLRMAKRLLREAQHSRLETVLELSASFQALAHATKDHRDRIDAAVGRLGGNKK